MYHPLKKSLLEGMFVGPCPYPHLNTFPAPDVSIPTYRSPSQHRRSKVIAWRVKVLSRKVGKTVTLSLRVVHLQLRGQLLIRPRFTGRLGQNAHRLIEFSVGNTLFATTGSPDLIIASLLLLDHLGTIQHSADHLDHKFWTQGRISVEARVHEPRMNGQGLNLRVSLRKFSRQQRVGEFALSVTSPFGHRPSIHGCLELVELDSLRGSALIRKGREHDDTYIGTGKFGGLE